MRYAVLSDIHGNLEALKAVLDDISGERIDQYLSLGDIVGYGADPKECIRIIRSLEPVVLVAGNQDRKSTRLNSSHRSLSRMPSSA